MKSVAIRIKFGRLIASFFYLEPLAWYAFMWFFGNHAILKMSLGLWDLRTDSQGFLVIGRIAFIAFLIFSTAIGVLIILGKSFQSRKLVYIEVFYVVLYLTFLMLFFSLPDKFRIIENIMVGRICLLATIWDESKCLVANENL